MELNMFKKQYRSTYSKPIKTNEENSIRNRHYAQLDDQINCRKITKQNNIYYQNNTLGQRN